MWHLDEFKKGLAEVGVVGRLVFLVVAAFFAVHAIIFIGFIIIIFVADPVKLELFGFWIGAHIVWELIGAVVYWSFRTVYRILQWILLGE